MRVNFFQNSIGTSMSITQCLNYLNTVKINNITYILQFRIYIKKNKCKTLILKWLISYNL